MVFQVLLPTIQAVLLTLQIKWEVQALHYSDYASLHQRHGIPPTVQQQIQQLLLLQPYPLLV